MSLYLKRKTIENICSVIEHCKYINLFLYTASFFSIFAKKINKMIQRIQSLYLLLVIIGSVLLFFLPITAYFSAEFTYLFNVMGLDLVSGKEANVNNWFWILIPINALIVLTTFIALFMYKKRTLQNKIIAFAFLFNAVFVGLLYWITDSLAKELSTAVHYQIAAAIPLLNVLFFIFAAKAIRKDEAKVRAADRLR